MALSDPRTIFGIHSVSPYNRSTGEFYGIAKVLDNSSITIASELIQLTGGSQKFPWAIENGISTAEISLSVSQYDDFLLEIAYGKAPTANSAEANGSTTTIANVYGTSAVNASTGIASVGLTSGDETDAKFGKYIVKVASSTTVDLYASSDVDFARGTDGSYSSDLLLIEAGITIPGSSATVASANYGIEFTGGSGTVSMTVGDTAEFFVRPPNSKSMDVVIGGSSDVVPEVGLLIYAAQRGTQEMFEIDVYRAKLTGMPFGFTKNEFSVAEITAQAFYDSTKNGVLALRHVTPV